MAGFVELFGRLWVWCISLFGGQNYSGDNSNSNLPNVTSFLEILQISDVTSIGNNFLLRNAEFYKNMSWRHGAPNYIFNWHFMSGAAVFVPKLNSNILFERLFYSLDSGKGHRSIVDKSFIVFTQWSSDWTTPMAPTQLLQVNETAGTMYTDDLGKPPRTMEGPEDPRVIFNTEKEELHVNFNALTPIEDRQMFGQTIKLFQDGFELKYKKTEPLVQFEHLKGYRAVTEKNWVPILIKGELHYVYSLSPLRILKCDVESDISAKDVKKKTKDSAKNKDVSLYKKICRVQFKGEAVDSGSQTGALRSGTNWVEHSPGVYFSFARTRIMHKKCSFAIYRPHLIVLKFNIDSKSGAYSDPHLISVSEPITEYDSKLFELYAKKGLASGNKCDDEAVLTPGSISRWTGMTQNEDSDVADVIISINDDMTALLRIKGFGQAVQEAIDSAPSVKQSRSISRKGTLVVRAEREMTKFVEKAFSLKSKQ
jgi:hypothetical protein